MADHRRGPEAVGGDHRLPRAGADAATSYTAQLLSDPARAAKKLGEEAVETVIASLQDDP